MMTLKTLTNFSKVVIMTMIINICSKMMKRSKEDCKNSKDRGKLNRRSNWKSKSKSKIKEDKMAEIIGEAVVNIEVKIRENHSSNSSNMYKNMLLKVHKELTSKKRKGIVKMNNIAAVDEDKEEVEVDTVEVVKEVVEEVEVIGMIIKEKTKIETITTLLVIHFKAKILKTTTINHILNLKQKKSLTLIMNQMKKKGIKAVAQEGDAEDIVVEEGDIQEVDIIIRRTETLRNMVHIIQVD